MSSHAHALPPRDRYALRNDANHRFQIVSSVRGSGTQGATIRALISSDRDGSFRYEVIFRGEYSQSKPNFDEDCYHETALSLIRSQLESHCYRDTRILLEVNSGLPRTELGVQFEWDRPEDAQ